MGTQVLKGSTGTIVLEGAKSFMVVAADTCLERATIPMYKFGYLAGETAALFVHEIDPENIEWVDRKTADY